MRMELTNKEFRLLLDLAFIGNWVLNSQRPEDDRFEAYDRLEQKLFGACQGTPMQALVETWDGHPVPSRAYHEGGIHEAIGYYEDIMFYEILAEELSRRDMAYPVIDEENLPEMTTRFNQYMEEFQACGIDRLFLSE